MVLSSKVSPWKILLFGCLMAAMMSCEETTSDPTPDSSDSTSKKLGWKGSDDPNSIPENLANPFSVSATNLPEKVDLSNFLPPIGDQGQYGTCVAWATGYYAKTALEAIQFELTPSQLQDPAYQMSAKYLFTALPDDKKGADCNGSDFTPALNVMLDKGIATKKVVPYSNLGNCASSRIESSWNQDAANHKIKYFRKIDNNLLTIKQALAGKMPVILGAKLDDTFMNWNSDAVYQSAKGTTQVGKDAYHAMCIVGYDNSKGPAGAFKVVNSWSDQWGSNGYIWVDYNFMFNEFAYNKNFFIAVNEASKPNTGTDPTPVTSGVNLAPWVDSDFDDPDSAGTWRKMKFDIHNIGNQSALASSDWGYAYIYYNAFNANDYGIIFYDRIKNQGAYKSINFEKTDEESNTYGFVINANVPAGKSLSSELFSGFGIIRTYPMPTNLTGQYYLVLAADVTDKFMESDENNNLFYTTEQDPILFVNGMNARIGMMSNQFQNVFTKFQMQTNGAKRYQSAVNAKNRNAYTPEEILGFLKKEARNGNLAKKIAQVKVGRIPHPGFIQSSN